MFYNILMTVDVLIALGLIALVLLQHGRGADAGAAFGSGSSTTMFGARGSASFLSRATAILAALFFVNSLGLAYTVAHQSRDTSVVEQVGSQPEEAASRDDGPQGAADVPAEQPQSGPPEQSGQPEDVPR